MGQRHRWMVILAIVNNQNQIPIAHETMAANTDKQSIKSHAVESVLRSMAMWSGY